MENTLSHPQPQLARVGTRGDAPLKLCGFAGQQTLPGVGVAGVLPGMQDLTAGPLLFQHREFLATPRRGALTCCSRSSRVARIVRRDRRRGRAIPAEVATLEVPRQRRFGRAGSIADILPAAAMNRIPAAIHRTFAAGRRPYSDPARGTPPSLTLRGV